MVPVLSKLYAVRHNTTLIEGITSQSVSPQIEHAIKQNDGHIEATHVSVRRRRPMMRFTTEDIAAALSLVGLGGLAVSASVGAGTKMFFRLAAEGGGNATGNTALRIEMVKGMLIPVELNCEQGGEASIQILAQPSYDGTNAPLIFSNNVALEGSPTSGTGARFTLGPLYVNGSQIPGVKRMRANFGLNLFIEDSDGEIDPSYVGVQTCVREYSWTVLSRTLHAHGLDGVIQGATPSVAYLRKKALGAGLVAEGTGQHISFTMLASAGRIFTRSMDGSGPEGAMSEVVWQPYSTDATTAPVSVNLSSTIPSP